MSADYTSPPQPSDKICRLGPRPPTYGFHRVLLVRLGRERNLREYSVRKDFPRYPKRKVGILRSKKVGLLASAAGHALKANGEADGQALLLPEVNEPWLIDLPLILLN